MVRKDLYVNWLFLIVLCVGQYAHAEATSGEKLIGSLLASPEMCGKTAVPLNGGKYHGHLNNRSSALLHFGPSVICPNIGTLTKSDQFVILGRSQSAFGKPWYKIELLKNSKRAWIPAQYVIQGEKVVIPQYTTEQLESINATTIIDLNVRECPDTSCERIGSLKKDTTYVALESASNGWYFVQINEDQNGWASGKYLTVVDHSSTGKELVAEAGKENAAASGLKQSIQEGATVVTSPTPRPKELEKDTNHTKSASVLSSSGTNLGTGTSSATRKSLQKTTGRDTSAPAPTVVKKIDPCTTSTKIDEYREKSVWRVEQEFAVSAAPHEQCGTQFLLTEGKVLISIGESEEYYRIAAVPDDTLSYGYLLKSKYEDQYIPKLELPRDFDVSTSKDYLLYYEEHWNSFEYKALELWEKFVKLYVSNLELSICITAFVLGTLMLPFGRSRKFMLRLDQFMLRLAYFTIRSPNFWRMIRKLTFILLLTAGVIGVIAIYVLWIWNVANERQQIMGAASLALMSTSIGWFGARVAGFFTGLLMFFLSFIEFLLFTAFLFFLFLAPSLLLLLAYYVSYRRRTGKIASTAYQFDNDEIERIHEKMFKLRNFYPETIISWARHDTLKEHWQQFKDVMEGRTSGFDSFFVSFGRKEAFTS